MKKVIEIILTLAIAIGLYLPARDLAVLERGNTAFGGEVLIPIAVLVAYVWYADWVKENE